MSTMSTNSFSQFTALANRIQATSESSIKELSKEAYKSQLFGKFGWVNFVDKWNAKFNTNFPHYPPQDMTDFNIADFLHLLQVFLQMRCIDGKDEQVGIQVTENNNPLSENSAGVCYSALLWYFNTNGHYGSNPMHRDDFGQFFDGFKKIINNKIKKMAHSKPLFYYDMNCLTSNNINKFSGVVNLWFKAIISVCYTCFFRIDEILSLKMKDVKLKYDMDNVPYFEIVILDRKVSLSEPKTFLLYNNCLEPGINGFYFLSQYIKCIASLNVLNVSELFFFGSAKGSHNGNINFQCHMKSSNFSRLLKTAMNSVGLDSKGVSTHTFRRGGARHRLMYGKFTWSLDVICTWASWSGDSSVLQRYLIDCLSNKQTESAMRALKNQTLNSTLHEQHEVQMLHLNNLNDKLDIIIENKTTSSTFKQSKFQVQLIQPKTLTMTQENEIPMNTSTYIPRRLIQYLPCKSVKDCIDAWCIGYPGQNIPPMREWTDEDRRLCGKRQLYKSRKDIGIVYLHYRDNLRNEQLFWSIYNNGITDARDKAAIKIKKL